MNKVIDKSDLVALAGELFRQKGYSATSIDDIAKRCGLTKGSIYHHFSGKEELVLAALEQVHDYYRKHIFSLILDVERPALKDFSAFNTAVDEFFLHHPHGCLLANLSLEIGASYEMFKDRITAYFDEWTSCYRKVFEQFLSKEEAAVQAEDAIAIIHGCILMNRVRQNLEPLRRQHARLVAMCESAVQA
jgi:AcrR family transcriptional regulator